MIHFTPTVKDSKCGNKDKTIIIVHKHSWSINKLKINHICAKN